MSRLICLFALVAATLVLSGCGQPNSGASPELVAKHRATLVLSEEPEGALVVPEVRNLLLGITEEAHDHDHGDHEGHDHEEDGHEEHADHDHESEEEHAEHGDEEDEHEGEEDEEHEDHGDEVAEENHEAEHGDEEEHGEHDEEDEDEGEHADHEDEDGNDLAEHEEEDEHADHEDEHAEHDEDEHAEHGHEGETPEEHAAHAEHGDDEHAASELIKATEPMEIVLVGQVGGLSNPWKETQPDFPFARKQAAFFLADPMTVIENEESGHNHAPGEECAFCEAHAADRSAMLAMVRFLGENDKVLPIDVRDLFDLKESDTVVVKGAARVIEGGMMVVDATGIYIRE